MAVGIIRYWAGARAAAGVGEEPFDAPTLGAVLDRAAAAHGPELERVFRVASFLVGGLRTSRETELADGDEVEVLPPFAGGSH